MTPQQKYQSLESEIAVEIGNSGNDRLMNLWIEWQQVRNEIATGLFKDSLKPINNEPNDGC